ncbi:MAG: anion permease [Hyphomonas sp.]|nr:inorganic phosphate transporter [Hyphomonas sp.]MCB9961159.1 inorganic phosphate transporter [Hyphomonas sp.]
MTDGTEPKLVKETLDKDLAKFGRAEAAVNATARSVVAPGLGFLFLAAIVVIGGTLLSGQDNWILITAAAAIGGYMALNIGANDVANNVGPAVGSKALTIIGALIIAAVCESAGALLAGGDVVSTISKGIISADAVPSADTFIWLMMAALISSALWVNLATVLNAPVSTTHSVVGGVMGSGIAAAGFGAVNWPTMGNIVASWVISPIMGGVIAAVMLAFIKTVIIYRNDKIAAARRWVPMLIALMAGAFGTYMSLKGLKHLDLFKDVDLPKALLIGLGVAIVAWLIAHPVIRRQSRHMENRNQSLRQLFVWPLIFSAALLSFAHGSNDVANAVGPLAAIVHTVNAGEVASKVQIPFWVMLIGASGISFGLVLFGPKLIRTVGQSITKLNPMRAYCVALAAAVTVIVASWLGLPVSSTHIAVGGVFGVGFFREWYTANSRRRLAYVHGRSPKHPESRSKGLTNQRNGRKLVRRIHFWQIAAAWIITVPASAALSAGIFLALERLFGVV